MQLIEYRRFKLLGIVNIVNCSEFIQDLIFGANKRKEPLDSIASIDRGFIETWT